MKNPLKTLSKKRTAAIITVSFCSLLLILSLVVMSSFINMNFEKLIVAKYGKTGILFSSNYLKVGRPETSYVFVQAPANAQSAQDGTGSIRISNFSQGNQTIFYGRTINYTLSARLVYMDNDSFVSATDNIIGNRTISLKLGNNTYTLGKTANNTYNTEVEFSSSLIGRQSSTDNITVTFDSTQVASLIETPENYKPLYIEVTATPTPLISYSDLGVISGRLCLALSSTEAAVNWEGYFNDDAEARTVTAADETITPLSRPMDGFNYVINGFGSATITLRWNSNYIELNKGFIKDTLGNASELQADELGWKTIEFTPAELHYETQFYKSGTYAPDCYDTWNEILSYVDFSYIPN